MSRHADKARYTWLTAQQFADAIGASAAHVRALIADGWFDGEADPPELMHVGLEGAKRKTYRIHPNAVKRFLRERGRAAGGHAA